MKAYHKNNEERNVRKVFQDAYEKYDLMNDLMSFGIHRLWKKQFISMMNPQKGTRLVDVASGTGDIAKLFLQKVNYQSTVCCLDENKSMLELNKKKNENSKNIKYFYGTAEKLPFEKNYFDYYSISFGIRNVSNINATIKEAYRVLKPGGRFLCLEFSKVKIEILNKFYKVYSKSIPMVSKLVMGKSEPYEYLINSIDEFCNQEELVNKIKENNFSNVSYRNLTAGIVAIHSAWKV